jgi:hypothetical protein
MCPTTFITPASRVVDHLIERRTKEMTYEKPEIHVVGRATDVIESLLGKGSRPSDGSGDPTHTTSAYDLDD